MFSKAVPDTYSNSPNTGVLAEVWSWLLAAVSYCLLVPSKVQWNFWEIFTMSCIAKICKEWSYICRKSPFCKFFDCLWNLKKIFLQKECAPDGAWTHNHQVQLIWEWVPYWLSHGALLYILLKSLEVFHFKIWQTIKKFAKWPTSFFM